jgi:hypothetical protein
MISGGIQWFKYETKKWNVPYNPPVFIHRVASPKAIFIQHYLACYWQDYPR